MTQAPIATPKPATDPRPDLDFKPTGRKRRSNRSGLIIAVIAVVAVGGFFAIRTLTAGGGSAATEDLLYTVKRDDLRISVVESGSLESGNSVDIKSQLEGRVQILRLVPEGTRVKEGEILCELDVADMVERETAQEINYERARASFVAAQKSHEILESDGKSRVNRAQLDVDFAEIDLRKYTEGDWPQKKRQAETDITIAEEELKRARDKADWSEKLEAKGFITKQELEADQLSVKKREIELELSNTNMTVLREYTYDKDIKTLQSNHEEAQRELERVEKQIVRELVQSQADLRSKEATYELEKERLDKLRDQIKKSVIRAPQDGLVVYNNSSGSFGRSSQEPIEEGSSVRERQTIFKLPDVTNMIAKIKIHESAYDRVTEGLRAVVSLDAFPDKTFAGRMKFVAPLPDSQQWWMNPDLKVYTAEVQLGGDTTMLKPGMSCSVEIEVDTLEDVLFVPLASVFRKGNTTFCYVDTPAGVVAKPIKTGMHNNKQIHITEGLEEGDRVFLAPPRKADTIEIPETEAPEVKTHDDSEFPEVEKKSERGGGKGGSGGGSLSYEDYQKLPDSEKQAAYMKLSPADQSKARSAFMENMSPEMRERIQEAMKNREGGGSSFGGGGGRPDGGDGRRGGGDGRRGGGGGRPQRDG